MAADALPWTFGAGGDYSERMDWLTDVLSASSGPTQHRRLRQSPRVTLAVAALEESHARRRLEALLRDNASGLWRAPVAVDACALTSAASATDTVLALQTAGARFVEGGYVLLQGADSLAAEVAQVATGGVGGSSLTLEAGLASAWPAGTRVTPLRTARLSEFPTFGRFTSDASDVVDVAFALVEPLDDDAAIAGDTYRSFPVWPFRPVWTSDPQYTPERVLQGVDFEIAPPAVHDLAGVPQARTVMQFTMDTREDVVAFRQALYALAGRWSPAWVPSWVQDMCVVAAVANGATSIDIEGPLLADLDLPDNQRDIRIELRDGTVLYRRVTGITSPSAAVERLALDSAIAAGFAVADVLLVSWLTLCTQDTDTNLLRYWTRDVMECELTWRQLVHGL